MAVFGDTKALREENRMRAFQIYAKDWKKQNPDTVERKKDVFTYKTKRGLVKSFRALNGYESGIKGIFKVQGFWFAPVV